MGIEAAQIRQDILVYQRTQFSNFFSNGHILPKCQKCDIRFTVLILSLLCRVVCIFACSCKLSFCTLTDGSAAALDMLPPSLLCQCLCSTLRQAAQSGQTFCFALLAYINNWQVYFYLSIWACVCVRACVRFPILLMLECRIYKLPRLHLSHQSFIW